MKKTTIYFLTAFFLMCWFSCSKALYPNGKTGRKAYKSTLKDMREGYQHFTPVKLPLDSLGVKQWEAPSPNFDIRKPALVIIHQTEQNSCQQSLKTLTNAITNRKVSAHYLICKNGTVYQLVDERYRAWQAGVSRWGSIRDINSISLGIELDNTGKEPFPVAQINSLLVLLHSIKERYHIPTANFIAHADVAPTRRKDPSTYFPWEELSTHGYGYWQDSVMSLPPENFDYLSALRLIGYDIRDTSAAIVAFKRHFIQTDVTPVMREGDLQVLYDIYQKYDR